MSISLESNVQRTIDAINDGLLPVVEPGDGNIYVLNTTRAVFGTLIYTQFDLDTRFPDASYSVRYGHQHFIHQAIFAQTMIRSKLDYIADLEIPGQPRDEFDPMIIPGCTPTYPTEVPQPKPAVTII